MKFIYPVAAGKRQRLLCAPEVLSEYMTVAVKYFSVDNSDNGSCLCLGCNADHARMVLTEIIDAAMKLRPLQATVLPNKSTEMRLFAPAFVLQTGWQDEKCQPDSKRVRSMVSPL